MQGIWIILPKENKDRKNYDEIKIKEKNICNEFKCEASLCFSNQRFEIL